LNALISFITIKETNQNEWILPDLLINASNADNDIETRRTNATLRNDWNKKLKKETKSGLKLFRRCPPLSQRLFENIVLFSFLLQV